MTSEPSETELKMAWEGLFVTTSFEEMISCPAQKALLTAIARNMKKKVRKERNDISKKRFPD